MAFRVVETMERHGGLSLQRSAGYRFCPSKPIGECSRTSVEELDLILRDSAMRTLVTMLVGIVFVLGEGVSCVYASDEVPSKDRPRTTAQVASGKKVVAVGTIEPSEIVDACGSSGRQNREPRRGCRRKAD